jgi:predicted small lipoprotein YifL
MRRCSSPPAGAAFPALPALTLLALALLTGCGTSGPAPSADTSTSAAQSAMPAATGRACGSSRTAAGVPILVEIARGPVGCGTAMRVEHDYAAALASGKVPGTGGGAPVTVNGWVCEGFNTPEQLRTGDVSKCTQHTDEILAVLPAP